MLFATPHTTITLTSTSFRTTFFWRRHLSNVSRSSRRFSSRGFKLFSTAEKLEEENWAWYTTDTYYPVRIGQTFKSRYQVLGKLGYGAHSTAWLGRDSHAHRFVTLKICERNSISARREIAAYEHIHSVPTVHAGAQLIRQLLDSFVIAVSNGEHLCLVHEPLGMSVKILQALMPDEKLPADLLKSVLKYLLLTLDCLHTEHQVIHTDLQASNIHLRVKDESIFKDFEKEELEEPSARKIIGDHVIYETRALGLDKKPGPPILCDFGEARFGKPSYTDVVQPRLYRAPEVILNIPWSCKIDIWTVGVSIWDLFESQHLFRARGPDGEQSSQYHLAEMCAILGQPPLEYLQQTETSWEYFESDGILKAATPMPDISLEFMENRLSGDDKIQFLTFVRKMLQWLPERRQTAKQLLQDPWLNR